MIYRLGEFFCGPGGLACGARTVRVRHGRDVDRIVHAWASDYDENTCLTYANNICGGASDSVIHEDIRNLDIENDPRLTPVDGFAFGFPCNDFSVVGEQRGFEGNFGPLYQYGIRLIRRHHPMWFLAENVGGLKSANGGEAMRRIFTDMIESGYRIYPHLYKFEQYGVPQTRHRIIIVGIREDQPFEFRPPDPAAFADVDVSAATALADIPADAPNNEQTNMSEIVVQRLMHIAPGQNAFTANLPPHLALNVAGARISQIYKRLDPNLPAYTVTGSGGGGTHIYHWDEPRALTNRERARLQTFPDDYEFIGTKESVRKQIGMAVPPRGASVIFEAILKTFAGRAYPSIDCNIEVDV